MTSARPAGGSGRTARVPSGQTSDGDGPAQAGGDQEVGGAVEAGLRAGGDAVLCSAGGLQDEGRRFTAADLGAQEMGAADGGQPLDAPGQGGRW